VKGIGRNLEERRKGTRQGYLYKGKRRFIDFGINETQRRLGREGGLGSTNLYGIVSGREGNIMG